MATAPTLEFEKPIAELERQIDELKKMAGKQQLSVTDEIAPLEKMGDGLRLDGRGPVVTLGDQRLLERIEELELRERADGLHAYPCPYVSPIAARDLAPWPLSSGRGSTSLAADWWLLL